MPLEIRELVIKATISSDGVSQGTSPRGQEQAAIISACVDQVLTILKEKSER